MQYAKYMIIGNGIAGHSASAEIRKLDPEGSIRVISKEPHHTYYRLKLTEMMARPIKEKDLYVTTEEKAKENRIDILLSKAVVKIQPEEKTIELEDGEIWQYEKLLLATGAQPFIPPTQGLDKKNIISIRTLEDVNQLYRDFANAANIIVIGGGLLGLEAAWALHETGKTVDVIERAPWLLSRQLDELSSKKLTESLQAAGLRIHTNAGVEEILGEEAVSGVLLNDGTTLPADGILFNIGVRPDIELAEEAGIPAERGILVNEKMETKIPGIYAAGDCIQYDQMVFGLWTQSNAQGKVAGKNMACGKASYDKPKLFSSLKLGEIQLFSSGDVQNFDEVREYQKDSDSFKKFFFREGKPVGGILYGDIKDMGKVNQILDGDLDFDTYKKQAID